MELRQAAVRGVAWSAAQNWASRAISFVVMLALARLVLPEAFGLVAYASVFVAFAQVFVDQGFGDAIIQCPQLEPEHLDTAFWISVPTGVLLAAVGLVGSRAVATLLGEPQLASIVSWLSISFVLSALSSVQQALLRRRLAFRSLAVRSLAATASSGLIAVAMAYLGYGVWSLVAKMLVDSLVGTAALWQVSDWRPAFRFSRRHFRELFTFGVNILGANIVNFFSSRSDSFLIGYFLGSTALGYYALAYNLLMVITELLVSAPNVVLFPAFSRLQSQPSGIASAFSEVTQLQSIIAFPIFLGTSIMAPEIITFLYGPQWQPSIPVARILMLAGILCSASYSYSSVIRAAGKPSWRFGIWSLTAVLNLLGFALVVRRGIVAVAATYVVIGYLVLPLYFLVVRRLLQVTIRSHLRQYIPALCSSLVMVALVSVLRYAFGDRLELVMRLFIFVFTGALAYLVVLRIMRPLLYGQIMRLASLALPRLLSRKA